MKILCVSILIVLNFSGLEAQNFFEVDKSPMDMVYYPNDYAHDRRFAPQRIGSDTAMIRVIYSRPAKNGRELFGKLMPYGKVWRTGANEATEIKFYRDLRFGGMDIKAGTYALFTIPETNEWTIILNSALDHWGAYSYKAEQDVLRIKVPVMTNTRTLENFSIVFEKVDDKKAMMFLGWDTLLVKIPIGL